MQKNSLFYGFILVCSPNLFGAHIAKQEFEQFKQAVQDVDLGKIHKLLGNNCTIPKKSFQELLNETNMNITKANSRASMGIFGGVATTFALIGFLTSKSSLSLIPLTTFFLASVFGLLCGIDIVGRKKFLHDAKEIKKILTSLNEEGSRCQLE